MKLVTFNIRCDFDQDGINSFQYRSHLILQKIESEKPDVICFQEVLPHIAQWLKEHLVDYYVIGCGRDENLEDEQETIAYRKQSMDLLGMETYWLSLTPYEPGSRYKEQSICPRVCTDAVFMDLETKTIIRVVNIHLDHEGEEARILGIRQILEKLSSSKSFPHAKVILAGDFNALPNAEEIQEIKECGKFKDVTTKIEGSFHDYGRLLDPEKIDYIFIEKQLTCTSVERWMDVEKGIYLSDHYPICANIIT